MQKVCFKIMIYEYLTLTKLKLMINKSLKRIFNFIRHKMLDDFFFKCLHKIRITNLTNFPPLTKMFQTKFSSEFKNSN